MTPVHERRWLPRGRVIALQLAVTSVLALAIAALYAFGWYPAPFLTTAGGLRLLALHVGALFVAGPLLTAVLYRPGKRGLMIDVWLVAVLQVAALVGGLYAGYIVRPVYLAVLPMRVSLVRANELYLKPAPPADPVAASPWGPVLVAVDDPPTEDARAELMFAVMGGAPDIDYRPAYYRPIDSRIDTLLEHAQPLEARLAAAPALAPVYADWRRAHGFAEDADLRVYPVAGINGEVEAVLDARTRRVAGFIALP